MARLDSYSKFPSGMEDYLESYGWHFSKNMYNWAISMLKKENPTTKRKDNLDAYTKEQIDEMIKKYGVTIQNHKGYDVYYLVNVMKAGTLKSSVDDEIHLIKAAKDVIDDINGYPESTFTRFYADCIAKGLPIMWEDML